MKALLATPLVLGLREQRGEATFPCSLRQNTLAAVPAAGARRLLLVRCQRPTRMTGAGGCGCGQMRFPAPGLGCPWLSSPRPVGKKVNKATPSASHCPSPARQVAPKFIHSELFSWRQRARRPGCWGALCAEAYKLRGPEVPGGEKAPASQRFHSPARPARGYYCQDVLQCGQAPQQLLDGDLCQGHAGCLGHDAHALWGAQRGPVRTVDAVFRGFHRD